MNCSNESYYEKEANFYTICAWNPDKKWIEEGLQAISEIRGKVATISHGICEAHKEEVFKKDKEVTDEINRWNEAIERVKKERDSKIINFPTHG